MCKLSIIVPVYNVEKYLRRCLDSILRQTYLDFEVICVDDGSKDHSLSILEEYADKDERIKVIHKENGGLVSARKEGILVAKGEYATYVDSDDWIDADMYEYMMHKIEETGADIVSSGYYLDYGANWVEEKEKIPEGVYKGNDLVTKFLSNMINTKDFFVQNATMHVWQKVFRTSLLRRNQLQVPEDITVGEDAACTYPCFLEAESVAVIEKSFYHYCIRGNSIMGNTSTEIDSCKSLYRYLSKRFETYSYPFLEKQLNWMIVFLTMLIKPSFWWKENFVFPYIKLMPYSKVVIYGMGRFGKVFKQALESTGKYEIVAVIDANRRNDDEGRKCLSLQEFVEADYKYDYILITILKKNLYREVKKLMVESGITEYKILEPDAVENICFENNYFI